MMVQQNPTTTDRFVRPAELQQRLGVSKLTLYRMRRRGEIPEPIRISAGRIGWRESTIATWIEQREREAAVRSILRQRESEVRRK